MLLAKQGLQLGGFMVCLTGVCYLFTLKNKSGNRIEEATDTQTHTLTVFVHTHVTELTLVLRL